MTKSYLELRLLFWRDQYIRATNLDSPWLLSFGSKHWCEYELLKCAIYYIYLYPRKLSKWISGVEKEWPQDCLLICHFQFIVFTSVTNADHGCFFFFIKKRTTYNSKGKQPVDWFSFGVFTPYIEEYRKETPKRLWSPARILVWEFTTCCLKTPPITHSWRCCLEDALDYEWPENKFASAINLINLFLSEDHILVVYCSE